MIPLQSVYWPRPQPLELRVMIGTCWPWGWHPLPDAMAASRLAPPDTWLRRKLMEPYRAV